MAASDDRKMSDVVDECCRMWEKAATDSERITVLLFAAQHIRSDECDSSMKTVLFETVGTAFLKRMLGGQLTISDADNCPKPVYVSTALAIITGFASDPRVATTKNMSELIPFVLRALDDPEVGHFDGLDDCFSFFGALAQRKETSNTLMTSGALSTLSSLYARTKAGEILDIVAKLLPSLKSLDGFEGSFNRLMTDVAEEFDGDSSATKFELCTKIRRILLALPQGSAKSCIGWTGTVFKGLRDILTSRIGDAQRDPAMKLASAMLEVFTSRDIDMENAEQFRLLLVRLSSIEVRMQLEDRPLEEIRKSFELVTSCFIILEEAIVQLTSSEDSTIQGAKGQMIEAYAEASAAVFPALTSLADRKSQRSREDELIAYAMTKFLCTGLVSDVLVPGEHADITNYVMTVAKRFLAARLKLPDLPENVDIDKLLPTTEDGPTDEITRVLWAFQSYIVKGSELNLLLSCL